MPYIASKVRRHEMDEIYEKMVSNSVSADGDLNYLLYKYCKYNVPKRYNIIKNYIAELRATATEIERRILAEYEDKCIEENGDV